MNVGADERETPADAVLGADEMDASVSLPKKPTMAVVSGASQAHAVRLPPGADLVPSLLEASRQAMSNAKAESAFVMTAVGSLSDVTLRMAATDNKKKSECAQSTPLAKKRKPEDGTESVSLAESTSLQVRQFSEHFEVVSLVGTFSCDGGKHLHMSVSNAKGDVLGGHLMAGTVFTTLELVLGTIQNISFLRKDDNATGFRELAPANAKATDSKIPIKKAGPIKAKAAGSKKRKLSTKSSQRADQVILETMAKLYNRGIKIPERKKVANLTRLHPKTMTNAVTKLKKEGLLECPSSKSFKLTAAAVNESGETIKGGATNEDVHKKIKEDLKGKALVLFELLTDGKEHQKEDIAQELGYPNGKKQKAFTNLLSAVKSQAIIFYPTKDTVQLVKEACFPFDP